MREPFSGSARHRTAEEGKPSSAVSFFRSSILHQTDKVLVIVALALGLMDVLNVSGPFSRISLAALAIVLLAIVLLRQGGALNVGPPMLAGRVPR